jgi:streptomycin 6-kinase
VSDPYATFISSTRARVGEGVEDWLAGLSGLIEELTERWELRLGEPFGGGYIGYTVAATRAGTEPAILKVTYPDGWFPEEIAALVAWDGNGAVEVIDHDPRGAVLLERAVPGTTLLEDRYENRALRLAAGVLERLWIPDPGGLTPVATEVGRWVEKLQGRNDALDRPLPPGLADEAVGMLRELVDDPRESLLLHGDLHLGNVLAATREPWLAIDPKPLVGDREFDVTALIRDKQPELVEDEDAPAKLQRRFDLLAERLSCDRERLRGWSIGIMTDYALSCFEGDASEDDRATGRMQVAVAQLLRGLRA